MPPRIVLIHATQLAMEPISSALTRIWPEAEAISVLDESLSIDRAKTTSLTPDLKKRIADLTNHAGRICADGVLFTCSAFGPAIEAAKTGHNVPVLKPNEAMFDDALTRGNRIALLHTFGPAGASMAEEFRESALARGVTVSLETVFVPDALEALNAGDTARHDKLIADAAAALHEADAIMLAQFSMARAKETAQASVEAPVMTSPDAAVAKLKALISDSVPR
ncbi:arylsulfatase [Denitrobaculum tricleocarpae]|uniref:Arylsulfatase n=1 Tax=Denitrobaculum tricleocarpae TaxID=2591009 RepID=A0A545TN64_9PROT|nr:arylsulfatase [Denitrobaculum tricleocarpae]